MADDDPMFLGKVDDALEKVLARRRRGGVIRVVEEHQFGFSRDILRNGGQVRQVIIRLGDGHKIGGAAGETCPHWIHRVARTRDEDDIAWIDERERHVANAFLGTDQRQDLRVGIEHDAEPPLVPVCHRPAKRKHALIGRVLMMSGIPHLLAHPLHDGCGCR